MAFYSQMGALSPEALAQLLARGQSRQGAQPAAPNTLEPADYDPFTAAPVEHGPLSLESVDYDPFSGTPVEYDPFATEPTESGGNTDADTP